MPPPRAPRTSVPTSAVLITAVKERIDAFHAETGAVPPIDAVTASGSGLDPDVSPANARAQADASPRRAASRPSRSWTWSPA